MYILSVSYQNQTSVIILKDNYWHFVNDTHWKCSLFISMDAIAKSLSSIFPLIKSSTSWSAFDHCLSGRWTVSNHSPTHKFPVYSRLLFWGKSTNLNIINTTWHDMWNNSLIQAGSFTLHLHWFEESILKENKIQWENFDFWVEQSICQCIVGDIHIFLKIIIEDYETKSIHGALVKVEIILAAMLPIHHWPQA